MQVSERRCSKRPQNEKKYQKDDTKIGSKLVKRTHREAAGDDEEALKAPQKSCRTSRKT